MGNDTDQSSDRIVDAVWEIVGTDVHNAYKLKTLADEGVKLSHPDLEAKLKLVEDTDTDMEDFRVGLVEHVDNMRAGLTVDAIRKLLVPMARRHITKTTTTALKRLSDIS